jgi:nucleotide-binding universal stress UspA family protein
MSSMTHSASSGTVPSARPDNDPETSADEPVEVSHVVVPLDGSPFSERALPVADWIAAQLGADVHLVEVVPTDGEGELTEGVIRYLDDVTRRHHAAAWDVVHGDDVAQAIADAASSSPRRLVCMATHGRDRTAGPLGSVAAALLGRSERPVVLVGPRARPSTGAGAPVVAAVGRTGRDEALVSVASSWATRLARRLEIVTIAQPLDLADVAALVVLEVRSPEGAAGWGPGSHAAHIVHDAPVPALAVPLAASSRAAADQATPPRTAPTT